MQGGGTTTNINKLGIILVGILLVAGAIAFFAKAGLSKQPAPTATVTMAYSGLPDTQGLGVRFNGRTINPSKANTYTIPPGSYIINISKPGYQPFTTKLVASVGQTYDINAQLQPTAPPPSISSLQQLNTDGLGLPQQATVVSTNYFYNNTWAVVVANAYGSDAALVAKYDTSAKTWDVVLGPGTAFTQADASELPDQITGYLTANNYVGD